MNYFVHKRDTGSFTGAFRGSGAFKYSFTGGDSCAFRDLLTGGNSDVFRDLFTDGDSGRDRGAAIGVQHLCRDNETEGII